MLHMICVSDIYWCNKYEYCFCLFHTTLTLPNLNLVGDQNSKSNYGDTAQYGLTHGRPNVKGKVG